LDQALFPRLVLWKNLRLQTLPIDTQPATAIRQAPRNAKQCIDEQAAVSVILRYGRDVGAPLEIFIEMFSTKRRLYAC
jgi:hypothetical protein